MLKRVAVLLTFTLLLAAQAVAQTTIFIVRHAERADVQAGAAPSMAADPDLSDAGRARAEALAMMLKDAAITLIFATEFKRTQQTAAPVGKAIKQMVRTLSATNTTGLVNQLKAAKGNVLVVGHSNSIPDILKGLGVTASVTIGDEEYDNMFVVTMGAQASMVRLHYR
jgi:broad specificity phosphatase PhoE